MNKKRSFYNITIGIGSQILSIALGIIIPKLFLFSFGSEMNGFLNSVTQIFAYFTLLEAGVGAATIQALYGPIGKGNQKDVSAIIAATDHYYRKTGRIYFIAVITLSVIYPVAIQSDISTVTMILIILFNGVPGVISYYYQGKYILLLQAEGKNYINTALSSISSTLISVVKIVMLLLGCNIIAIQLVYLIVSLMKVLVIRVYIKRNYQWLDIKQTPDYEAIGQKNAAFVNQICDLIFRNTDTIILSAFCGLKVVSVYAMYNLLFSMVRTALDYIAQGFSFIMGQTYNRDIEHFIELHDLYETYRMAFTFALFNIAFLFIIPFIKLYTAGVTDIDYIDYNLAVLFTVFFLLTSSRVCEAELINYAQHFKKTQSRCIIEAVINLTVSLLGVNLWGIYGVLIGTIVALLYRMNDMILYANRRILKRGSWVTYRKVLSNVVLFVVIVAATSKLPWSLDSYFSIIGWAIISGIIICSLYFMVASVVNQSSFRLLKEYIKLYISKMLKKIGKRIQ